MDLISRQDAIDAICTWDKFGVDERSRVVQWHEGLEPYVHLRDVVFAIENLPSAESKIIRCKDCRHNHNCEIQYHAQADDLFYCGWGAEERKEAQAEIKEHIDPERLVQMIRYSSQYNAPCPEWVYKLIEATAYDD